MQPSPVWRHETLQAHVKHVGTLPEDHKPFYFLSRAFLKCLQVNIRAHHFRDDFNDHISLALKAVRFTRAQFLSSSLVLAVSDTLHKQFPTNAIRSLSSSDQSAIQPLHTPVIGKTVVPIFPTSVTIIVNGGS